MYRFFSLSILQKKEANKEIITAIPNVDTLPGSSFPRNIIYQPHRATINQRRYSIKITPCKPFILLASQRVKIKSKGIEKSHYL